MTQHKDNVTPLWKALLQYGKAKDGSPQLLPTPTNVALILANDDDFRGCFARNEFSGETELIRSLPAITGMLPPRPGIVDEYTLSYTQIALSVEPLKLRIGDKLCAQGIEAASRQRCYNPLQDSLRELKWDGTFRLDEWMSTYLGAKPSKYVSSVGRWWLISAMARAFRPGCQADHVLVLEGPQGAAKSSALRILATPEFFTDQLQDLSHKDAHQGLNGIWMQELGEMDGLSRVDVTKIKAFITVRVDRFRPSYGKFFVQHKRSCVFAGTTNSYEYLRDDTGNRRFWPVRIGQIDLVALARDRELLLAEARLAYESGSEWWPGRGDEELLRQIEAEQEERYQADEWEGRIATWATDRDAFSLGEALGGALSLEPGKWSMTDQRRAGACLRRLGFEKRPDRFGGRRSYRWHRKEPVSPVDATYG